MTTLLEVRDRCKQESDNVGMSFVSDPEWLNYINSAYTEAYGLFAQAYGADYFIQSPSTGYTFTTTGLTQDYALPSDFWKLLGVDVLYGAANQWTSLRPYLFSERNKFNATNTPMPAAGQQFRVFYIPTVTLLVNTTDVLVTGITANGGDEYVVADACIRALAKEESDVSVFVMRKQALKDRLEAEAENRDAASADRIADVRGRRGCGMEYHLFGGNLRLIGFQATGWAGLDPDLYGVGYGSGWWP